MSERPDSPDPAQDEFDDPEGMARDPGVARERTDLAWNRSGLAVAATVAIVLRRLWPLHGGREDATLVLIAVGAVVWAAGMRLGRRLTHPDAVDGPIGESGCRMLTLGTVVLAVAGLVGGIV